MQNTQSKYLVSIIIVTWNADNTLERTLDSIINHYYDNIEIIIIDGDSQDKTKDIILKYERYINIFISEKDKGIYDAMNKGIKLSRGNFLYFLGADDKLLINTVNLNDILINENTIYYGKVLLTNPSIVYGKRFLTKNLIAKNICHQSIFYPATILKNNLYSLKYKYLADYALNLKLWNKYKFEFMDYIIAEYNTCGLSSTNTDLNFKIFSIFLVLKYFGLKGLWYKMTNLLKK
jgi:glycosyltransferase involved in cell wall biosynthesis